MKITIEQKQMSDGMIEFSLRTEERKECYISFENKTETTTHSTFDTFAWACEMMALYTKSMLMAQHPE